MDSRLVNRLTDYQIFKLQLKFHINSLISIIIEEQLDNEIKLLVKNIQQTLWEYQTKNKEK